MEEFDSEFKNQKLYNKMKRQYEKEIATTYNVTAEKYADNVENNEMQMQE